MDYFIRIRVCHSRGLPRGSNSKEPPAKVGGMRSTGSIPGSGRLPGEGHGSPLQYSCLENPTDRGAWRATVPGVTKSRTRLKPICTHAHAIQTFKFFSFSENIFQQIQIFVRV